MTCPQTIVIDARLWGRTGIGRYVKELCTHLPRVDAGLRLVMAGAADEARSAGQVAPYDAALYSLREQWWGGGFFRSLGPADLWHFPHYNVPVRPPTPFVVTVHDLIHFKFPQMFGRGKVFIASRMLKRAAGMAGAIICPSESTRRDLAEMLPQAAGKITVIPNGVSEAFRPVAADQIAAASKSLGLDAYIICMGDRKPYKGFKAARQCFERLAAEYPGLKLVSVGQRSDDGGDIIQCGYVDDEHLRLLYAGARCLLFPSAYEGFGLPVLEAMACGCPVVCGRGSSLDEVCGQAALQVDVSDPAALAEAVKQTLRDDVARELAAKGLAQAAKYTWGNTARQVASLYRQVCDQPRL
ncbi:MAG: glycosyltransferase family 1 protein [Planctomycetaceae bacterium]|nr:glycosyltransferase family 4 protein [Planctomycetaceae bacterium]